MKNVILLCFAFCCIHVSCFASHIWGADMTYTCQGNGDYLITYDFYRDCIGIPAPASFPLQVWNVCDTNVTTYTMLPTFLGEVNTHCPGQVNTCHGGNLQGIEKWRYQVTIHLPDTCSAWFAGVTQCCRDAAIMTLQNPLNFSLYAEVIINNTVDCDTSAILNNDLVIQVCKNQPVCIDPGIFDTEGDSIVAYLATPLSGPNTPMQYDSGFSFLRPITLDNPLNMDPVTGTFCMTPLENDWAVYSFVVDMYREGRFLGRIHRDVNIVVVNCAPQQPTISNINGGLLTDTFACENQLLCFDLFTTPFFSPDSTWINFDSTIAGAQYSILPGQNESAQFCWTPTHQDVSTTPYCFNGYVKDNSCLAAEGSVKKYCITVYDSAGCLIAGMNTISQKGIEIYPQPANDFIRIKFPENDKGIISLSDVLGNKVLEKQIEPVNNEFIISTDELQPAIYLLTFKNLKNNIQYSKKVMVNKSH